MKKCRCGKPSIVDINLPDGIYPYCEDCLKKYFENCKKAFGDIK